MIQRRLKMKSLQPKDKDSKAGRQIKNFSLFIMNCGPVWCGRKRETFMQSVPYAIPVFVAHIQDVMIAKDILKVNSTKNL